MSRLTELPNITCRSPLSSYLERDTIRTTIKWNRLKLRRHHDIPYRPRRDDVIHLGSANLRESVRVV